MSDFVLMDGDQAMFMPVFGSAVVVVRPGRLAGSGPGTINGKAMCVDGDESKVTVPGCVYVSGPYTVPGVGTLSIKQLAGNQKATKTKTGGKPVLLKGATFTAQFQVTSPAQLITPTGPVADGVAQYSGMGSFLTANMKFSGS